MAGKFELKKSKNDKYFFNLLAGNGQIILKCTNPRPAPPTASNP